MRKFFYILLFCLLLLSNAHAQFRSTWQGGQANTATASLSDNTIPVWDTGTGTFVDSALTYNGTNFSFVSGNVGIGTTGPSAKLSVKGAGTGTGVNFQTTDSSDTALFKIYDDGFVDISGGLKIRFGGNSLGTPTAGAIYQINGQSLKLGSNSGVDVLNNSAALVTHFDTIGGASYISTGNVGIGTKAPAGAFSIGNAAEGGTWKRNYHTVRFLKVLDLAHTSDTTTVSIPAGAKLDTCSTNVNAAVTTSAATNTWEAAMVTGSTVTVVPAGESGALNTKEDTQFDGALSANPLTTATTQIRFTAPGAETFTAGTIEGVCGYRTVTSMANL